MKHLLALFILITSSVFANTKLKTQIVDIDYGRPHEEPMLMLASGDVAFYPKTKGTTFEYLVRAIKTKEWFEITINSEREIIYISKLPRPQANQFYDKLMALRAEYTPTVLPSLEKANEVFSLGRKDAKKVSQCFNRAHIWSYEWETKHNVQTSKVWLYFTRKYIRRYRFEWWFHVAPTVLVKIDNQIKERVMDLKYLKGPSTIKQWSDTFLRDRSDCPIIKKFSDYANFPESSMCYVQRSNPYFYQPVDLEKFEHLGEEKMGWVSSDVSSAYLEAFDQTNY